MRFLLPFYLLLFSALWLIGAHQERAAVHQTPRVTAYDDGTPEPPPPPPPAPKQR
jgi:hypothetical protein